MERQALTQVLSLQDNEAAFDRYKLLPRVLVNVTKVDTETEILGSKVCGFLVGSKTEDSQTK